MALHYLQLTTLGRAFLLNPVSIERITPKDQGCEVHLRGKMGQVIEVAEGFQAIQDKLKTAGIQWA